MNTYVNSRDKQRKAATRILIIAASFLLALLVGALMLWAQGKDVLETYYYLLISPFVSSNGKIKLLANTTPLIFAGLAAAIAFKCSVFNIGLEGQLYAGALAAAFLGTVFGDWPKLLHVVICILSAMIVGGLIALLPGILKVKYRVHEVVSTIMMNYIVSALIAFIVNNYFRGKGEVARTPEIAESAHLTNFVAPSQLSSGIIIAVVLCIVLYVVFRKTTFGWRIDAAGKNLKATRYSGINSTRLIIATIMMSGMLAGLLGAERVMGAYGYMELNFSTGYGYDGIIIATIANNDPMGILLVSLLMGLLKTGALDANIMVNIPTEWVNVLTAFIFVFVVAGNALQHSFPGILEKYHNKKEVTAK